MSNLDKDRFKNGSRFKIGVMHSDKDSLDLFVRDIEKGDFFTIIFNEDDIERLKKCIAEYEKLNV
jgi:hypothetical protein